MSENKEIEKLTGYHREAAKMAAFYLCGKAARLQPAYRRTVESFT